MRRIRIEWWTVVVAVVLSLLIPWVWGELVGNGYITVGRDAGVNSEDVGADGAAAGREVGSALDDYGNFMEECLRAAGVPDDVFDVLAYAACSEAYAQR